MRKVIISVICIIAVLTMSCEPSKKAKSNPTVRYPEVISNSGRDSKAEIESTSIDSPNTGKGLTLFVKAPPRLGEVISDSISLLINSAKIEFELPSVIEDPDYDEHLRDRHEAAKELVFMSTGVDVNGATELKQLKPSFRAGALNQSRTEKLWLIINAKNPKYDLKPTFSKTNYPYFYADKSWREIALKIIEERKKVER